jgi:hypothetical protein
MHRPLRFLLDNHRPVSDPATGHQIANSNFHQITPAEFAVDREIEQGTVSQPMLAIEHEADFPNLFRLERPLGAQLLSGVPGRSSSTGS